MLIQNGFNGYSPALEPEERQSLGWSRSGKVHAYISVPHLGKNAYHSTRQLIHQGISVHVISSFALYIHHHLADRCGGGIECEVQACSPSAFPSVNPPPLNSVNIATLRIPSHHECYRDVLDLADFMHITCVSGFTSCSIILACRCFDIVIILDLVVASKTGAFADPSVSSSTILRQIQSLRKYQSLPLPYHSTHGSRRSATESPGMPFSHSS